jgi:hypothetical protein
MHTQIIMDATGDTRHYLDASDRGAAAEARRRFLKLKMAGYIAAKRTGSGASELVREFDPTVKETLFMPRLVGG